MIEAKIDTKALEKIFKVTPEVAYTEFKKSFGVEMRVFLGKFVKQRLTGRPGLFRRTGMLAKSFDTKILGTDLNTLRTITFTTSEYARIQEFGGEVKPKKARALAIPLKAAKTKAGVSRGGPRKYTDLFFIKTKTGNALLVRKQGKGIEPMFVLKKRVVIPARMKLMITWKREKPKIIKKLNKTMQKILKTISKIKK